MDKLFEMDPLTRFSSRAQEYARFRPDYPPAAIDAIFEGLDDPRRLRVADIGAGTGISSRRLADRGVRVFAIEPNAEMRGVAEPHPRVEFLDGSAESIPLSDGAVDLVTCFQAFHWFRPDPALAEFSRILRTGGRLAVVWNERDQSDAFTAEYGQLIRRLSKNHPAERREQTIDALVHSPRFHDLRQLTFRYEQSLSLEGLIGRARSASYLPSEGRELEEMIDELTKLHRAWSDVHQKVTLIYRTAVYLATVSDGK